MGHQTEFTSENHFWFQVDENLETGCWEWTGSADADGYGKAKFYGKTWSAHRLAYELEVGPIPEGMQLDHLCRTRNCVNPAHLEPVTCKENIGRGERANSNKTHCPQGHPYSPENTYWFRESRQCRTCRQRHTTLSNQRRSKSYG